MSYLEHLVENGLVLLEKGLDRDEWMERMSKDVNWSGAAGDARDPIEHLWAVCQYITYVWVPTQGDGR